ncbi:hypothetical protein KL918_000666 [Ogataea parapolymorpha]|uniref:ABC transporter CDR4 n=1 Tax=Ogataea parapolymorpha (strain ATCC 26012 / BCRC 20466 / JCM 22074 / NRRL Y-7560 / DL-1) TaxID=871575 RepID=W1Q8C5_OGAPD|nr:ABC transporter CDR4 [Ogataea parapolymorpha DL-1]ESW97055.1 ABC transporter CDR4 [Ogataea parapolymorpha DL-1]KAG7869121.1 hypothetical protein KL918_000666 [Ogataea parapolymorpha]KAG7875828.1 hypothetical protein KL916_000499 [Ogataea parapolymorpha]
MSKDSISVPADIDNHEAEVYEGFADAAENQVRELARELTHQSRTSLSESKSGGGDDLIRTLTSMSQVPGVEPSTADDPRLDPFSDSFDSKFWVKNARKLMQSDPDHYKPTSLGIAYKNLRVQGIASDADFQPTVLNIGLKKARDFYYDYFRRNDESRYFDILKPMDALMKPGTVTVVLGRPGAGCSTLLKTISSHTYGLKVDKESVISYDGLSVRDIKKHYRGEVVYSAETDVHFPQLTVGQTLQFAATMRTPDNRTPGITREQYAKHMAQVYMATYGLSHTYNTKVGNEFIRGVSGGERKRVSIAEVSLCGANLQCWDNATRGLDSATALEFIRALKTSAMLLDTTSLIAIYQCSQSAYDLFDYVILLYDGYQIYYGPGTEAKAYFERMGYECPPRQTTADYLTSITSPAERVAKKGWENKVPKTPKEFNDYWKASPEYKQLLEEIDSYIHNAEANNLKQEYRDAHVARQSKAARPSSPYTLSYGKQVRAIMTRNIWRTKGDPSITLFSIFGNSIMGLILSSLFYNLSQTTGSFYTRTAAMFFAVLFNGFSSMLEIMALFESREIVEKHKKFALYHPSADAFASVITELPTKLITAVAFNLVFYFMIHFKREPGAFFFYFLINFMATLVMSGIFRSIGSFYRTLAESMTPSALLLLALVIYTGFALPTPSMHGWSRWINYIDPVAYCFEALIANEFHGVTYKCSQFIPAYPGANAANRVCSAVSSIAGEDYVDGDRYIYESFRYKWDHRWRNFGIVVGFTIFFTGLYLTLVENSKGAMQKGEIIVFQRSTLNKLKKEHASSASRDIEATPENEKPAAIQDDVSSSDGVAKLIAGKDIFHWRDVCYEVKIKTETRRILDHVDGWVKPGTLTALMGASGAGKTTLLDVLANRVTMGVVSGSMFVNGRLRDGSFQRNTGYVQQQDLHLRTSTVREALRFSAYLRQGKDIPKAEKDEYVENVINILEMNKYADAIVGVAGEGLNVEQRKRLTIGVELAAKPQLLLFLDEPTSGLDSQTAWSICQLMRKLADNGQAVLCTIHQPSAILLKEFDRLLFLAKGGKTVYFGELGENCQTLIDYFEKYGAPKCPPEANPAEWMLEVIGAAPGSHALQDYHEVWLKSSERHAVREELKTMERELAKLPLSTLPHAQDEFASGLWLQYYLVTKRVFEQYWRTPSYIWNKILLTVISTLFNGFSFYNAGTSMQGLQNQMLSIFMLSIILLTMVDQMLPQFVAQRSLYEVRERPSKTFSWVAFVLAQVTAEIPYNWICGTLAYFCWYYPVGLQKNAAAVNATAERGALSWLNMVAFFCFSSTLGQAAGAAIEISDNAANLVSLLFTMSLNFCGALIIPTGFWVFMYRVSPITYWLASILSTGVGGVNVECAEKEYVHFPPPSGMTCGDYMSQYVSQAGGYILDASATDNCAFCPMKETNMFLKAMGIDFDNRWRDWGIFICYIAINIFFTVFLYWLVRVPKKSNRVKDESALKSKGEQQSANSEEGSLIKE